MAYRIEFYGDFRFLLLDLIRLSENIETGAIETRENFGLCQFCQLCHFWLPFLAVKCVRRCIESPIGWRGSIMLLNDLMFQKREDTHEWGGL